jgi:hypothetical protein
MSREKGAYPDNGKLCSTEMNEAMWMNPENHTK